MTAQVSNSGCVAADVGVNGVLYANSTFNTGTILPPAGSVDWFKNITGRNIIDQTNAAAIQSLLKSTFNPLYEARQNGGIASYADEILVSGVRSKFKRLVDAVWARDHFGGTGGIDQTSYNTASKNAEDPAIWDPGPQNVLGKNDLIDVAGHMFRNVDRDLNINDLWFVGLINRAEPGGDAYMDFEFFIKPVLYNGVSQKFTSGGPDLGHTAFKFDNSGNITALGDIIFNLSLSNGGSSPSVEVRVWVSRADYISKVPAPFGWGPNFDGAFNGSPFGYASIIPKPGARICGFVNADNQLPIAPPWGTRNTKASVFGTSYSPFSVAEVGLNMTSIGLDNYLIIDAALDSCTFPWRTFFVKTRASNAFTAQLKDFAGPYSWAQPSTGVVVSNGTLSCNNPVTTLTASPLRNDVTYFWTTTDGNIISSNTGPSIQIDKPGTYFVTMILPGGCPVQSSPVLVTTDPALPKITAAITTGRVSCDGNNGSVTLSITGGTAPYNISWTRNGVPFGTSTQTLTGLTPGTYVANITDAAGCSRTSTTAIIAAGTPIAINGATTPVSCFAGSNGAITITPVSGLQPFTYYWSNGQTTQNLTNVAAGTYTVTVTDTAGCSAQFSYTVNQPSAISLSAVAVDDNNPTAVANGSITLSNSGGTPAYTYSWTSPGGFTSNTKDITALGFGIYTVLVTDANGCAATLAQSIYEPENCSDGIDNDNDGLTDCDDSECKPAAPGSITGDVSPCTNQNTTYSVVQSGALTYQWTVPINANIISGQGTSTVVVRWTTTTSGSICVRSANNSCSGEESCISVGPRTVPLTPTAIIKN